MAGLMMGRSAQAARSAADPKAAADPRAQADSFSGGGEQPNVSPEEQGQYDQFVKNAMKIVYDEKAMPALLKSIHGAGDPVHGLANATVAVVARVEDSAVQAGSQPSGDVLEQGGTELLEHIAELAGEAGIHDYSEEELGKALTLANAAYSQMRAQQGRLPVADIQQELQALQDADQAGTLEQMVPGISEAAKKYGAASDGSA